MKIDRVNKIERENICPANQCLVQCHVIASEIINFIPRHEKNNALTNIHQPQNHGHQPHKIP